MFRSFVIAAIVSASLTTASRADRIDDLMTRVLSGQIPGMQLTVVQHGKVVRSSSYGKADLENDVSVSRRSVFEIGSDTKQFTAVAVLMLAQDGKLNLDDPVGKYLDGMAASLKNRTLRSLLTHTSGVNEYLGPGFEQRRDYKVSEIFDIINKKPADFDMGATWSYSNGGYFLLGLVIEKVSGLKWEAFIQQKIFTPLEMKDSSIQNVGRVIPHRARGYVAVGKDDQNSEILRPTAGYSAGAILSTGDDLAKWVDALEHNRLVKREWMDQSMQDVKLASGRTYPYGFGQFLGTFAGYREVQHGGNTYGFSAQITRFPTEGLSIIILSNGAGASFVRLAELVAREYLKHPAPAKTYQTKHDPDWPRTSRMIDALSSVMSGKLRPELLDPEFIATLATTRGKGLTAALHTGIAKVRALFYVEETKIGDDSEVIYELHAKTKAVVKLKLLISKDGRLVRVDSVNEAG